MEGCRGKNIFRSHESERPQKDDWLNNIADHNLRDWINVYNSAAEIKKRYDAGSTNMVNYMSW